VVRRCMGPQQADARCYAFLAPQKRSLPPLRSGKLLSRRAESVYNISKAGRGAGMVILPVGNVVFRQPYDRADGNRKKRGSRRSPAEPLAVTLLAAVPCGFTHSIEGI
jgi:hypothetical protein